jgi:ubiquitin carboxyl-terminal hydrolase 30
LKKFLNTEKVENYFCYRCWHGAALKYLSVIGAAETEIEKLRSCGGEDQCDCKTSLHLQRMPWSNSYSHILKQLIIARFPKVFAYSLKLDVKVKLNPLQYQNLFSFESHFDPV